MHCHRMIRLALASIALTAVLATSAQAGEGALRHKYTMRGQVFVIDNNSLIVCVGESDGAKIGQVLDVVRHVQLHAHKDSVRKFRRTEIGKVRITSRFDEHYANAEVVKGKPRTSRSHSPQRPEPASARQTAGGVLLPRPPSTHQGKPCAT